MIEFRHKISSSFPRRVGLGKIIIDELCMCGMLRSMHEDTNLYGRGAAFPPNDKKCQKFVYRQDVLETE